MFTIQCSGCNEKFTLPTSIKVKGPSGHQYWENNVAAVWGQMSTGGGHTTLQETMSVLGLPTMTKKSFMAAERRIGEWSVVEPPPRINDICWKTGEGYSNFTK